MSASIERKLLVLCHTVFKTDKGAELLALLETIYVNRTLYKTDAREEAYGKGKHDLIQDMRTYLSMTEEDLVPTQSPEQSVWD